MKAFRLAAVLAAVSLGTLAAAPPVPSLLEISAPVGKPYPLSVKADKGKKIGTAKTFDPAALAVARLHSDDAEVYEYWVFPNAEGTFYLPFWTEGETAAVVVKVVAGGGGTPPTNPKDPPVQPQPGKLFLMLVRPDGPVQPDFAKALDLAGWKELKAQGHAVKDYPASEVPKGFKVPANLPAVVRLRVSADATSSAEIDVVPLPTTAADVAALAVVK